MSLGPTLSQRCARIELLVLDVDGVLTDGSIIYADNNTEIKQFHVRDGSGLALWKHVGRKSAIITGRSSPIVEVRAREAGIDSIFQGKAQKWGPFQQILFETGLTADQACFIGDDVPDLPVMRSCGLAIAVADACPDVLTEAHYVTQAPGGRGAVRESIELILGCQGQWQPLVQRFRNEGMNS
jgi:3-deoxy-D-manno-octulosonate 8-phosphate phosphatase (KDO 8-P phosphatase)